MKALISYSGDVAGFRKWLKKQKPDKVVFFRRRKGKRAPFRRKS